ncbi:hypothetical protein [Spiroplasma endosymbiont of Amphibalanus improvisus]|uniref:hypothetical protein n=1 Tax=Spiroplasma endosymbiont of Amphibalanus improvisus TaxID=3066327 RepID=UPI00313DF26C
MDDNNGKSLIEKTKDFKNFKKSLMDYLKRWEEKIQRIDKLGKSCPLNLLSERLIPNYNFFNIYGEIGNGKTTYLNLIAPFFEKENRKIIKFDHHNKKEYILNEIEKYNDEKIIFIIDSTNEIENFFIEDLFHKNNNKLKHFFIVSSWDQNDNIYSFLVSPDDSFLKKETKKILKYFDILDFSIREKMLMNENKNLPELQKNSSQIDLCWKLFENIFENIKIKNFYKQIAESNPIEIEMNKYNNIKEIEYLKKHHLIQFNNFQKKWLFSHSNITMILFFRKNSEKLKNLNKFTAKEIDYCKKFPKHLLFWFQEINKRNNIINNQKIIINYIYKNKINIDLFLLNILNLKEKELINFITDVNYENNPLTLRDIEFLIKYNQEQFIYENLITGNIDTLKYKINIKNKYNIYTLIIYWIFYDWNNENNILNENLFDENFNYDSQRQFDYHELSFNDHIKKTLLKRNKKDDKNFLEFIDNQLKINNSNNRYKIINFIFFRYINDFLELKIYSALEKSNLQNEIYAYKDKGNKIDFYSFVSNCWNIKNNIEMKNLDTIIYSMHRSTGILPPSNFNNIDHRIKQCGENNGPNDSGPKDIDHIGHRAVNYFLYNKFEKEINNIELTIDRSQIYRYKGKLNEELTFLFIKFIKLIFQESFYITN